MQMQVTGFQDAKDFYQRELERRRRLDGFDSPYLSKRVQDITKIEALSEGLMDELQKICQSNLEYESEIKRKCYGPDAYSEVSLVDRERYGIFYREVAESLVLEDFLPQEEIQVIQKISQKPSLEARQEEPLATFQQGIEVQKRPSLEDLPSIRIEDEVSLKEAQEMSQKSVPLEVIQENVLLEDMRESLFLKAIQKGVFEQESWEKRSCRQRLMEKVQICVEKVVFEQGKEHLLQEEVFPQILEQCIQECMDDQFLVMPKVSRLSEEEEGMVFCQGKSGSNGLSRVSFLVETIILRDKNVKNEKGKGVPRLKYRHIYYLGSNCGYSSGKSIPEQGKILLEHDYAKEVPDIGIRSWALYYPEGELKFSIQERTQEIACRTWDCFNDVEEEEEFTSEYFSSDQTFPQGMKEEKTKLRTTLSSAANVGMAANIRRASQRHFEEATHLLNEK